MSAKYNIEFLYRPGIKYSQEELVPLVEELRETAATCFSEVPFYQCLKGTKEELSNTVITVARAENGEMAGFCSSVLLDIPKVGTVFHLGLTCVKPGHRGQSLTHLLASKGLTNYLLRYRIFGKVWISNVACVLSSLGNVARYFEKVYPSPFDNTVVNKNHVRIANTINNSYRDKIYISEDATFDDVNFIFRNSVKDTVFAKSEDDRRYFHRDGSVNEYYKDLISFQDGDEVLQIGYVSILTAVKYRLKKFSLRNIFAGLNSSQENIELKPAK